MSTRLFGTDGVRGTAGVFPLDRATVAREGEPLELVVDVDRLHFFDPETGLAVGGST